MAIWIINLCQFISEIMKQYLIVIILQIVPVFMVPMLYGQHSDLEVWEASTFKKQPPEEVMDATGIKPGMVVGEIGAGHGRFTIHLARRVGTSGRIFANDIDTVALSYLRDRIMKAGIKNVTIISGSENNPNFPDGVLDMAFMVWTYHWFEQPVAMLINLKPSLKTGATVVMVEPDPVRGPGGPDHGVSPERVRKEAERAGYELISIDAFLPEDLIFILQLKQIE